MSLDGQPGGFPRGCWDGDTTGAWPHGYGFARNTVTDRGLTVMFLADLLAKRTAKAPPQPA